MQQVHLAYKTLGQRKHSHLSMEIIILSVVLLLSTALLFGPYYFKTSTKHNMKNHKTLPPKLPGELPLIGHLHRLRGCTTVARLLGGMADEHGPIFSLRLGYRQAVVVSQWELIKDCFTVNDQIFPSRPKMAILKHIVYKGAVFALEPHGPFWRDIRKIVTSQLFTTQQLEKLSHIRVSEVGRSVSDLYSMMLIGKSKNGRDELRLREAIKKVLYLSGQVVVSDAIPWLEWMDIGGYLKAMKTKTEELDTILDTWLHEQILHSNARHCSDLMDVMFSALDENYKVEGQNRATIIKATMLILLMAGSESTAEALIWAVSLLLNNPRVFQAAREELDFHVGQNRAVEEADIKKLIYLQAVVKETLRLYPPGPLAGPRESTESGYIGKYYVAKGTRLVVNVWKLHRDPEVWADPEDFRPERFLEENGSNVGFGGRNFEYIPFGSGRRMCPGVNFALVVVNFALARLIQGFRVSMPMNVMSVDMSEGKGLALPKVKPLVVVVEPRLARELYENYVVGRE
ncbi:cytochrome P450 [Striga asiatica]|uniref:Flavonoid-6-hydroxylase n=1 Tax=Striga asiatica TaxID=4170 RepID=A0A5A7PVK2_STRAF|nr:cytochrome P450 [Striga asiatica]